MRLDMLLAGRPEVGSRSAAARLITLGRVTVDGAHRSKGHVVQPGELVEVDLRDPDAEPDLAAAETPYAVAYEDHDLIVVDKPAGVVVHPASAHPSGTLVQALAARGAGAPERWRPGLVHRLDRDTSGLLVVAKSEQVHRALQGFLRARRLRREYIVLVDGHVGSRTGTIDAPLGRDRRRRTTVSVRTDKPRIARTHFSQREALPRTTLLDVRLETGRTHQIRAHFAAIGHPVIGDRSYGRAAQARLGLARQFLHSSRLVFPHPSSDATIDCSSELPGDLREALERARAEPAPR
jgi:23S rRNA pseudouridine1911/1915/1917 synthase